MTTKASSGLGKATKFFKRRRFAEAIRILEPQVFTYRENPKFYYILGVSCVFTNDIAGAYSYLKRAVQLDKDFIDARLALAVVHLKRMETDESLRLWLEVLDEDHGNRLAKQGLEILKQNASAEKLVELTESLKLRKLIPSPGFYLSFTSGVLLMTGVMVVLLVIGGLWYKQRHDSAIKSNRPEISAITIDKEALVINSEEKAIIMLTEKEIRLSFQRIKQFLETYDDNQARREINRLLLSNASKQVKERVKIFIPHVAAPTFITMKEGFSFQEIMKNVPLYEGCFIRWKGRITNLKISEKEITFDFLAGYHDQKILEGIIPAKIEFSAKVDPLFAYEILAQIVLRNEKTFSLRVLSIHELGT